MADDLKVPVGARVHAARKRSGMTQEALAAAIGKTPESISNIERGRQLPMLDTLADLGAALGVPLTELVENTGRVSSRSSRRLRLEARLAEHVRGMDDDLLTTAVDQVGVLARVASPAIKG